MPQPAIRMPYHGMNIIWNPFLNQQPIPVSSQMPVYQPIG